MSTEQKVAVVTGASQGIAAGIFQEIGSTGLSRHRGRLSSSATTVEEARWLEAEGCDAIVAQGFEAGGHHGMFLTDDIFTQIGSLSLVPQVVDSVKVPVIAAGASRMRVESGQHWLSELQRYN